MKNKKKKLRGPAKHCKHLQKTRITRKNLEYLMREPWSFPYKTSKNRNKRICATTREYPRKSGNVRVNPQIPQAPLKNANSKGIRELSAKNYTFPWKSANTADADENRA